MQRGRQWPESQNTTTSCRGSPNTSWPPALLWQVQVLKAVLTNQLSAKRRALSFALTAKSANNGWLREGSYVYIWSTNNQTRGENDRMFLCRFETLMHATTRTNRRRYFEPKLSSNSSILTPLISCLAEPRSVLKIRNDHIRKGFYRRVLSHNRSAS